MRRFQTVDIATAAACDNRVFAFVQSSLLPRQRHGKRAGLHQDHRRCSFEIQSRGRVATLARVQREGLARPAFHVQERQRRHGHHVSGHR